RLAALANHVCPLQNLRIVTTCGSTRYRTMPLLSVSAAFCRVAKDILGVHAMKKLFAALASAALVGTVFAQTGVPASATHPQAEAMKDQAKAKKEKSTT